MKFVICLLLALPSAVFGMTCPKNSTHKVVSRNTMWSVIETEYQTTDAVTLGLIPFIANASGITDPNRIFDGDTLVLPCFGRKETKKFVPFMMTHPQVSEISEVPTGIVISEDLPMVEIFEPQIFVVTTVLLPEFIEEVSEEVLVAEVEEIVQPQVPVIPVEAATEADAKPGKKNKNGSYQTEIYVPDGLVEGIREGDLPFPAVLATQKQDDGRWKKREEMGVKIQKIITEKGIGYIMTVLTKQELIVDSALRVDFGKEYSFSFPGEYLIDRDLTRVTYVNKKLPRKLEVSYKSLNEFLPKKQGLVSKSLHFLPPLVPQLVMAGMGNPVPLVFTAIGITSNKFASRQAKVPKSVQMEQQEKIEMLESKVDALMEYISSLQQNTQPSQLAQNVQ